VKLIKLLPSVAKKGTFKQEAVSSREISLTKNTSVTPDVDFGQIVRGMGSEQRVGPRR